MMVFIFERLSKVSNNWHPEGGVVICAASLERARELANAIEGCTILEYDHPDRVYKCEDGNEEVFIFPDAGCC